MPEIEAAAHAERLRLFLADMRGDVEQTVPGWKRFKTLVGDSLDTRRWFVSMHQAEHWSCSERSAFGTDLGCSHSAGGRSDATGAAWSYGGDVSTVGTIDFRFVVRW